MNRLLARCRAWWEVLQEEQADAVDRIPARHVGAAVFLAGLLTLYVEMVIVRWHASCFHAFAIFKNVSLLSCFLGLGIGFGRAERRRLALAGFLPLLALQAALFGLLSSTNLGGKNLNPVAEQLVMGTPGDKWSWVDAVRGNAFLAAVFMLNAVMFVPLGQLAGRLMGRLPKGKSYALNLLGSLTGIGVFFLLSLACTAPPVWMGLALLAVAPFLLGGPRLTSLGVASAAVIMMALGLMGRPYEQSYYSPYQVISLRLPDPAADRLTPTIKVNHSFYQDVYDLRPPALVRDPRLAPVAAYYNLPYRIRPNPGDVCIVGAGSGNDVAAALRNRATSVTAVEIDPVILRLGEQVHPERPYQDRRTHAVVNDARTFLRQSEQRFDLIVYGLLDSHTNLGAMTNVRLDSFVYTVEGFRDALGRLKDGGVLVVSYVLLDPLQGDKLYAMLRAAYPDRLPRAFANRHGGYTFVAGPGLANLPLTIADAREVSATFRHRAADAEVATDDWPFFYMQKRTYPVTYAVMIGVLLVLSAALVYRYLGRPRFRAAPDGVYFFLGAGFMLIETKAVTELGLVFGNTWSVVAVVASAILLLAYLANEVVLRRGPVPHGWSFALLGAALLAGLGATSFSASGAGLPMPKLLLPLVLTLPLFFAGLIFSSELAGKGEIGDALFANLLGAMLGGFLEYHSMYGGFGSLYPLGMALYAAAFFCNRRGRHAETVAEPARLAA